ncbi:MAG: MATE family efflux transporter [Thermodesulfobacteriota bacterium]
MHETPQNIRPSIRIWRLAWPQTAMMFFHFLIGFVDVYVAGQLSDQVQASLGIITQSLFFFLIIAMAFSNGAVSSISQSLGSGRTKRAQYYVGLTLELVFAAGVLLSLLSFLGRSYFLDLMQVPPEIYDITAYYLKIYLLLLPLYYLFIVSNAVFRARQQVYIPLLSMMIATLMNTLGDFGLSFGLWGLPELGFKGLPWATVGSIGLALCYNIFMLYYNGWLHISSFPPFRWIKKGLPYLWGVAWPAGLMQVLWHSAYLVLFAITASLPNENITALAALTAGLRVESILFLPAVAFNMTASILVGNYLGQGDVQGAKSVGLKTWLFGVALIIIMAGALLSFVPSVAGILSTKPLVEQEIINYLYFNIAAIPFTGTAIILGGVFIGAGATRYNMVAIGGTSWLVRLPLAYILGHLVLQNATGVWAAMLISQVIQASLVFSLFKFKDWSKYSMFARKQSGIS